MIDNYISYNAHFIDKDDQKSVANSLKNKLITTGPLVKKFEDKLSKYLGAKFTTVCNSGTAALHMAYDAIKLKKNDIVLMPSITFISSYNMAKTFEAKVYLVDIDMKSGQVTPESVEKCIIKNKLKKIKCLVLMYLGGYPENISNFYNLKKKYKFNIIEDACHAFGSSYKYKKKFFKIGSCKHSDISCFSFHPLKTITTGEGGAVTTNNPKYQKAFIKFRSHGFQKKNHWDYNLINFGFNYRLNDFNCALGISQLKKINKFLKKRENIYNFYKNNLSRFKEISFIEFDKSIKPSFHLFVIFIKNFKKFKKDQLIKFFLKKKIILQQHYKPIYKFDIYKNKITPNLPNADRYFMSAVSLPIHYNLSKKDLNYILKNLKIFFNK
ncbi:aminotransferase class I/II-fold pyridoxal phosphate-dependent enzyme [Candidatus Pelagibacter sp.]|nr:aminotransferase class I/II-fold pyridoxal phosphate-dependent enzyme [Candidatus Pelagibacter sp.]